MRAEGTVTRKRTHALASPTAMFIKKTKVPTKIAIPSRIYRTLLRPLRLRRQPPLIPTVVAETQNKKTTGSPGSPYVPSILGYTHPTLK